MKVRRPDRYCGVRHSVQECGLTDADSIAIESTHHLIFFNDHFLFTLIKHVLRMIDERLDVLLRG